MPNKACKNSNLEILASIRGNLSLPERRYAARIIAVNPTLNSNVKNFGKLATTNFADTNELPRQNIADSSIIKLRACETPIANLWGELIWSTVGECVHASI